jgi:hypothetical protein
LSGRYNHVEYVYVEYVYVEYYDNNLGSCEVW